jgi:uncharacterized protein (TIGR00297 family)
MTRDPRFSEDTRQALHIAMGALALLLRYLAWWEAAVLAGVAVAFNLFALPRIAGPSLYRPGEFARRHYSGVALYPASVLVLLLVLPDRRDIVAAAWAILAIGDGMATIVGRRVPGPRIPWNRDKSVAGSAAFVLFGGAAGAALSWWCRPVIIPPPYDWFSIAMPFAAALAAAAVETVPIGLDDNITVPFSAAGVLWWTSLFSEDLIHATAVAATGQLPAAVAANAAVAAAGYLLRTVTLSGAVCGAAIGLGILVSAGWGGWMLLLATFVLAVVASRLGLDRKERLGIAEGRGGRRGAGNAFANTGVAAAAALLASLSYAKEASLLAFVAALAAGGSDTVASEIGKAWGRRTYLMPFFRPVPPGTSGAVSLEGTAAGIAGAVILGSLGIAAGLVRPGLLAPIVAGATLGAFAESVLGATLEGPGILNNDALNFINTLVAATAALTFAGVLS